MAGTYNSPRDRMKKLAFRMLSSPFLPLLFAGEWLKALFVTGKYPVMFGVMFGVSLGVYTVGDELYERLTGDSGGGPE